jgi:photosystem II stability/assembly factor-like uncharacterized protein
MKRLTRLILAVAGAGLLLLLLGLAVGAQSPIQAHRDPINVPTDYASIQAAIDAAADGDEIRVKEGTYLENLSVSKGITLSGGWNAKFTEQEPGYSTIDGQGLGRAISITCATSNTVVTIDGFTVQGGNATGLGGGPAGLSAVAEIAGHRAPPLSDPLTPAEHVARLRAELSGVVQQGLYPDGSTAYRAMLDRVQQIARLARADAQPQTTRSPTQQAADCGGGVYSWNASLHLLRSTLLGSVGSLQGDGCGGGVFVGQSPPTGVLIQGNTLRDNIASAAPGAQGYGGGLYAVQTPALVVEGNVFELNAGTSAGLFSVGEGGGLFVASSPDAVVSHNQVLRNTANGGWQSYQGLGGGALLLGVDGASVTHNQFDQNLGILHGGGGGGGLAVARSARVVVADNEVTGNWGCMFQLEGLNAGGGGIALYYTDAVAVTGNVIRDNTATVSGADAGFTNGGGLDGQSWNEGRVADNTFSGNVACQTGIGRGGGASLWGADDAEVSGNTFAGNVASLSQAYGAGGGAFLLNTRDCRVRSNTFRDNLAAGSGQGHGGGLCVWEEGPVTWHTTVDANLFLDNQADANLADAFPSDGGACSIDTNGLTFTNNVVAGNRADLGGGLYLPSAQAGVVTNNTLVGNSDAAIVVDQYNLTPITITNNIVVSHTVGISVTQGATATVSFTLWHANGADIAGAGVVTQTHPVMGEPAFADPASDDYHLTIASAARDSGDSAGVPPAPDHDADGVSRPQGPAVDIGAYEWKGYWRYLPLMSNPSPGRIGWAVGDSVGGYGAILQTTDGGATWVRQGRPGEVPDVNFNAVSAVDGANAWVVGGRAILCTRDGGRTWEQQPLPAGVPTDARLFGVKAIDSNTAWAVGKPDVLLGTTDGHTWSVMPRSDDLHLAWPVLYSDVDAADAVHVWAVGAAGEAGRGEAVIAFYDGVQWRRQGAETILSGNGAALIGVSALDHNTAWAVGGVLFAPFPMAKTKDGGDSWQQEGLPPIPGMDTNRVVAVTSDIGWAAGDDGSVVYTTDAGTTWSHASLPSMYLFGITAIDDRTAWVVGSGAHSAPPGIIARTRDAVHWEVQSDPAWPNMSGISFVGARR